MNNHRKISKKSVTNDSKIIYRVTIGLERLQLHVQLLHTVRNERHDIKMRAGVSLHPLTDHRLHGIDPMLAVGNRPVVNGTVLQPVELVQSPLDLHVPNEVVCIFWSMRLLLIKFIER